MAFLFLWTVVMYLWWEFADYQYYINRKGWPFKAYQVSAILWLIYGTIVVTFILWEYLP